LKTYFSITLVGLYILFISLSISVTGCGKKGDLVRPLPPEKQQTSQEKSQEISPKELQEESKL
jgi:predicted small lipoprotein YifL